MKIRSALLVVCMLVVPGVALFSHRIPAGVRAAVREAIGRGMARWQEAPGASALLVVAASPPGTVNPAPAATARDTSLPPGMPPVDSPSSNRRELEQRLGELGAVAFECRPLQGLDGVHMASCRVALDASGQLMRVFQASGVGADEATRALVSDLAAWRQRMAVRSPGVPSSAERRF